MKKNNTKKEIVKFFLVINALLFVICMMINNAFSVTEKKENYGLYEATIEYIEKNYDDLLYWKIDCTVEEEVFEWVFYNKTVVVYYCDVEALTKDRQFKRISTICYETGECSEL